MVGFEVRPRRSSSSIICFSRPVVRSFRSIWSYHTLWPAFASSTRGLDIVRLRTNSSISSIVHARAADGPRGDAGDVRTDEDDSGGGQDEAEAIAAAGRDRGPGVPRIGKGKGAGDDAEEGGEEIREPAHAGEPKGVVRQDERREAGDAAEEHELGPLVRHVAVDGRELRPLRDHLLHL